jgi:hypothetical protein
LDQVTLWPVHSYDSRFVVGCCNEDINNLGRPFFAFVRKDNLKMVIVFVGVVAHFITSGQQRFCLKTLFVRCAHYEIMSTF